MGAFSVFTNVVIAELADGRFRPPNWSNPQPVSLSVTLPASNPTGANNNTSGTSSAPQPSPTLYFFDAVLRIEHSQEAVMTEHPVQVGPALVDHMYLRSAVVTLDIGMSDAMQSYVAGQYSSAKSKSVSAYQTFLQIQASRAPITLATRLLTYQNMQITDIRASETVQTSRGLRCLIYLRQIISATVSQTTVSARPNSTDSTNEGTKAPAAPSLSTLNGIDALPQP